MRRITANLAPSGVRKGGAGLDLPIAIGLLVAAGELSPSCTEGFAFCGELGLNGSLRHVPGMIALADATAAPLGLVVPLCDVREAALVRGEEAHGAATLADLVRVLRGDARWPDTPPPTGANTAPAPPDLSDVRGQALGRRAVEVAAAGHHHLLMIGPPGSGKTMLAERLVGLLPPLTAEEALAVTRIHSAAGCALPDGALFDRPPLRAPHHQASVVSLVGGGSWSLRPGEISLATPSVIQCLQRLGDCTAGSSVCLCHPPVVGDTFNPNVGRAEWGTIRSPDPSSGTVSVRSGARLQAGERLEWTSGRSPGAPGRPVATGRLGRPHS